MKDLKVGLIALMGIILASCNPKYYSPNTQNVPLLSQKNEKNISLTGNANQIEIQSAIALSSMMAIKANGGIYHPEDLENGNGGSGSFFEAGLGIFKPMSSNFVFETYGIFGLGKFENHLPSTIVNFPQTNGKISANLMRYGIQPNFGYKSQNFIVAISSRMTFINYSNIKGDLTFDGINQALYLNEHKSNFLIEPALTIKGGLEKIKLQLQYGYSANLTNSDFPQDKSYLTLGINFNLP